MTEPQTHSLCGEIKYSGKFDGAPVDGDPLSYDATNQEFTADSDDVSLVDTSETYSVVAELADWLVDNNNPTATTVESSGTINFGDSCDELISFTSNPQTPFSGDGTYDGNEMLFTLTKFDIVPTRCKIVYSCTSVDPAGIDCSELGFDFTFDSDSSDGTGSITPTQATYESGDHPPGVYSITITATAKSTTLTATTSLTLVDVCDPPTSITAPALTDQSYTITDIAYPDYTHPSWTVVPNYCPVKYVYSTTNLPDNSSAITRSDETFSFRYDDPIDYENDSQITTITGESYSIYNSDPVTPKIDDSDFKTTFSDPCLDPNFVTINAEVNEPRKNTADYTGTLTPYG